MIMMTREEFITSKIPLDIFDAATNGLLLRAKIEELKDNNCPLFR